MFDDTIIKNMDNPANYSNTNKLLWTNSSKSNLSDLSGLTNFNSTIKKSVKYVYLNNNNFSNIDVLENFENIVELQLMCNPNLSNIDGIKNHTTINYLTLHNCGLTSISGLTGCSELTKLSLQNNFLLTSLTGIENSTNLMYLVASNCNLTEVNSLANHSKVSYLNLANNVNLSSVKYIQHCKALNYIYLDNNINMMTTDVDKALNGTDSSLGTTVLIAICQNGYNNIPKKYWDLFTTTATVLDWSYSALGEYLTVDSAKWIKLKGRTDVTKLRLDGQTKLVMEDSGSYYGISSTLSTLTGMKALTLKNCSQINSLDFTKKMAKLYELDVRGISTSLTDYSALNACINIKSLYIDNKDIDLKTIVKNLNNMKNAYTGEKAEYWISNNYKGISLHNSGPWKFYDQSSSNKLTYFLYNLYQPGYIGNVTIDLSETSCTFIHGLANDNYKTEIILPPDLTYIHADCSRKSTLDFNNVTPGTLITDFRYGHNSNDCLKETMATTSNITIEALRLWCSPGFSSDDINLNAVKYLEISNENYSFDVYNLKTFASNAFTTKIYIYSNYGKNSLSNLDYFGQNHTITDISFINVNLSDTSWLSEMTQVTSLNLEKNHVSNISGLANLTNLTKLVLSNNYITNLTPLVQAIGDDNKIGYTELNISNNSLDGYTVADNITALLKLHSAGLNKIYITGNNFSENEISELVNGKTIDGVAYSGFGSENVVN